MIKLKDNTKHFFCCFSIQGSSYLQKIDKGRILADLKDILSICEEILPLHKSNEKTTKRQTTATCQARAAEASLRGSEGELPSWDVRTDTGVNGRTDLLATRGGQPPKLQTKTQTNTRNIQKEHRKTTKTNKTLKIIMQQQYKTYKSKTLTQLLFF